MGLVRSLYDTWSKITLLHVVIAYAIVGACVFVGSTTLGDGVSAKDLSDKWNWAYENRIVHVIGAAGACKLLSIFFKWQYEIGQAAEQQQAAKEEEREAPAAAKRREEAQRKSAKKRK